MASLWLCLLMLLSSLVLAGGYQLPSLRLLFQDGTPEENGVASSLHAPSESFLDGQRWWEWRTGGDVGRESPQLSRRTREDKVANHSSPVGQPKENVSQPLVDEAREKSTTEGPPVETTLDDLDEDYTTESVSTQLNAIKGATSSHAPGTTPSLSKTTNETESAEAGGHLVGVTATTLSPSTSESVANGTERVGIDLVKSKKVPTSSPKLEATSDGSTATLRPDSATATPGFKKKGAVTEAWTAPKGAPATTTTTTTIPVEDPSQKPENSTTILVGKCLLAIFLLALVAGIFIVLAGVLATLLWRQKRAYKVSQRNHTEMVCISSLLAAEEAEEAAGRQCKVKRMKMRAENGSETEMDNLTLNSFLPDH